MMELTEARRDALQELINISFGTAVASLAELLNIFIKLTVPSVRIARHQQILSLLADYMEEKDEVTLVQQTFHGEFFGEAVLAFPGSSSKKLVFMLTEESGYTPDMEIDKLELEVLLELGNIVLGACISRLAELLKVLTAFDPPDIFLDKLTSDRITENVTTRQANALLVQTRFEINENEVTGYLFIFLSQACLEWLFKEVDDFIKKFS